MPEPTGVAAGYTQAWMCHGCLSARPDHTRCPHNKRRETMLVDLDLPNQLQECRYHEVQTKRDAP